MDNKRQETMRKLEQSHKMLGSIADTLLDGEGGVWSNDWVAYKLHYLVKEIKEHYKELEKDLKYIKSQEMKDASSSN